MRLTRKATDSPPETHSPVEDASNTIPSSGLRSHGTPLLRLANWNKYLAYDEHPPTCIHYPIEWKLTVNRKGVSRDTESNITSVS